MRSLTLVPLLVLASPGLADQEVDSHKTGRLDDEGNILVIADTIRGQIKTDLPPVMVLDAADITAYGASSIGELIEAVSPQASSGRGRGGGHPVILLNGQRISNFRILRNIPPEAIRRMEVLPEEVGQRFGYPPNQRLINMILKDDYASRTLAGEYNAPTRGGFDNWEAEAGWLTIDGPRRLNVEAKIVEETLLSEGERGVVQAPGEMPTIAGDPDPAFFRSLVDASRNITASTSWSTGLGADGLGGTLGLDASYGRVETLSLSGLDTVLLAAPGGASELRSLPGALRRRTATDTFEGGASLNKPLGQWQLSATLDASHSNQLTHVDRRADLTALRSAAAAGALDIAGPLPAPGEPGFDTARFRNFSATSLATLTGQPFALPAGDASLTLKAGFAFERSTGTDSRTAGGATRLKRGDSSAGANIVLPLTSRRNGVAGAVGDVSLNLGGGINRLSDFGTLTDWSVGLSWSPTAKLTFQSSYLVSEAAPSLAQLGNPRVATLNVPVFDFARGETVPVTIINGGNPLLRAETQRDIKLSASWDLPMPGRSSLLVEYFRNSSDDVTQNFPLLTQAIEAAFPGRAQRDQNGRLLAIDRRPVTFDKVRNSRLRWGLNISGRIGQAPRHGGGGGGGGGGHQGSGGPPAQGAGAGAGTGAGAGGTAFAGGMPRGGRWNLALYHTLRFTDLLTISRGAPVLDQLAGGDDLAGAVSRHSLELEGGGFYKGLGLRLNGNWESPARGAGLRFGAVLRLDARLFVDLSSREKLVAKAPFLKGVRIAFEVDNIFDSRQQVTDASGAVPLAFQKDFRDPRGRFIGIDIRKMF